MKRVLCIGNSHAAAMRYGWEAVSAGHQGVSVDFLAQHAQNWAVSTVAGDGKLHSTSSDFLVFAADGSKARTNTIDIREYDTFVVVGCGFGPVNLFRVYRRFSFMGLNGRRPQVISKAIFETSVRKAIRGSGAVHIGLQLAKLGRPVVIAPSPLPSLKGFESQDKENMEPFRAAAEADDGDTLMDMYEQLAGSLKDEGLDVLPQPTETLASRIATISDFTNNALRNRTDDIRAEDDFMHMNADYGAIVWQHMLAKAGISLEYAVAT